MKEIDIRNALSDLDNITIEENTDNHITIWDEGGDIEKRITFRFEEKFSLETLEKLIYISPKLKKFLDKNIIASYLFELDKNLFTTLEFLCFMWDESDYDWLFDETDDEYAKFIMDDGAIGRMWNERNICIIDVQNIVKATYEMIDSEIYIDNSRDFSMKHQYFYEDINSGIMMTAIHELRHLMLETNILLPEDIYPLELGDETLVEEYCRNIWDNRRCWSFMDNFLTLRREVSL